MFYDAIENKHGLRHDPFKALIVPRPIGWVSTVSKAGIANIAPYSFFNAMGEKPHYVVFSSAGLKDSLRNINETGEFVCSLATWDLRYEMNTTSATVPYGVDEFPLAGLTAAAAHLVKPPRVKESPAVFECVLDGTRSFGSSTVVFGRVVHLAVEESVIVDGRPRAEAWGPVSRMGGAEWGTIGEVFRLRRVPYVAPTEVEGDGHG